jgi:hypothetical protein
MGRAVSAGFVLFVLMAGVSGCAGSATTPPVTSAQQECERTGGVWRAGLCERSKGY